MLDGIWWILCTRAICNEMPERFRKWNSVWRCYKRWWGLGLWDWALERLSSRYVNFSVGVMLDASHVKVHQDATRHPLPPRTNRRKHIPYDKEIGKNRHRVENFFSKIKRFRRIGTYYDKLPETYLGFVKLCSLSE